MATGTLSPPIDDHAMTASVGVHHPIRMIREPQPDDLKAPIHRNPGPIPQEVI